MTNVDDLYWQKALDLDHSPGTRLAYADWLDESFRPYHAAAQRFLAAAKCCISGAMWEIRLPDLPEEVRVRLLSFIAPGDRLSYDNHFFGLTHLTSQFRYFLDAIILEVVYELGKSKLDVSGLAWEAVKKVMSTPSLANGGLT